MSVSNIGFASAIAALPAEFSAGQPKNRDVGSMHLTGFLTADSGSSDSKRVSFNQIAEGISQIAKNLNRRLQFVVDSESNNVIVKVIDRATDKVIKVLPPEELQRLNGRIDKDVGFLFNKQV